MLLSHPIVGGSGEGFVIENLLACAPEGTSAHYYRTSGGAEIDLLLFFPDGKRWAVEIKYSIMFLSWYVVKMGDVEVQKGLFNPFWNW